MVDAPVLNRREDSIDLPPGFRFHPTDEEIITHYLSPKALNHSFGAIAIGEVDLNKCEPWDLPSKAKMGEKEQYYFFCQRDRKYPTGMRTNRATEAGYWKATGKDKEIYRGRGLLVGMKKTLVFYKGRAPRGAKTNWVMHEYRLEGRLPYSNISSRTAKDEWVVCRVFHKNIGIRKSPVPELERTTSFGDDFLDSSALPALMDPPYYTSDIRPSPSYIGEAEGFEFKEIPASSSSMTSYYSMLGLEENQQGVSLQAGSGNQPQNPVFYPQVPPQSSRFSLAEAANLGYLHQDDAVLRALAATNDAPSAIRRACKVEQYSNQSMVSPSRDTGVSTDRNTEISSVLSKHHYDDLDDPCSAGSVMELDNMWKY